MQSVCHESAVPSSTTKEFLFLSDDVCGIVVSPDSSIVTSSALQKESILLLFRCVESQKLIPSHDCNAGSLHQHKGWLSGD